MNLIVNLLKTINQFSYRQIIITALMIGTLFLIPVLLIVNQQRHGYTGKAAVLVTPIIITPITTGRLPVQPPVIAGVKPYLGKPGDEVVIWGDNFGDNPTEKKLFLDQQPINSIISWVSKEIRFYLPEQARSGQLRLTVGHWQTTWDKPLTVYTDKTITQLSFQPPVITVKNITDLKTVRLWQVINQPPKIIELNPVITASSYQLPVKIDSYQWIALENSAGQLISFWQDPLEIP